MELQVSHVILKNEPKLPIITPTNVNVANTQPISERRNAASADDNS